MRRWPVSVVGTLGAYALVALLAPAHGDVQSLQAAPSPESSLKSLYKPHTQGKDVILSSLTWSPDKQYAFYTVWETDFPESYKPGGNWVTLFSVRRGGLHVHKLYEWEDDSGHAIDGGSFLWSPDSRRVLMEDKRDGGSAQLDGIDLFDFDRETGERRTLTRDLNGQPGTGRILKQPGYYTFSPDGKYLLLTLGGDRINLYNKRLVRIQYASGRRKALVSSRMASFAGCWSPDGKHIAYLALPDLAKVYNSPNKDRLWKQQPCKKQHLYLMDANGRGQHRLTHDDSYIEDGVSWSADGRTLTVIRYNTNQKPWPRSLWTIRPDGTGLKYIRKFPGKEWGSYAPFCR